MSAPTRFGSPTGIARHVAIIADGNGRWARARGLSAGEGYNAGADTLKARLRDAVELGIEQLTVYSFSTENWSRPVAEVRQLISVLAQRIASEAPELHRHYVRIRFIGRRERVERELLEAITTAEAMTAENRLITLFVALNYGVRAGVAAAAGRLEGGSRVAV